MRPKAYDTWRHKGNGKKYIIDERVKFKDPVTKKWIDAISYFDKEDYMSDGYVRTEADFIDRFENVSRSGENATS